LLCITASLLLLYCCFTASLLLLYCLFTADLLYCLFTAALLPIYCCFTAVLLILYKAQDNYVHDSKGIQQKVFRLKRIIGRLALLQKK
jgi:hypothetical protein